MFAIALSVLVLAWAVAHHTETGHYQIAPAAGMAGAYRLDTRTGQVYVCSVMQENGCITLEEAHRQIAMQRQRVSDQVQSANDAIDNFTKQRAKELRGFIEDFSGGGQ